MKAEAKPQLVWTNPHGTHHTVDEDDEPMTTVYLEKKASKEDMEELYHDIRDNFDTEVEFGMGDDYINVYSTDPKIIQQVKKFINNWMGSHNRVKEVAGPSGPNLRVVGFKAKVIAKYEVNEDVFGREADGAVSDKAKAFLKKAIIPALMMMGPVACGTQHDDGKPAPAPDTKKMEQQVNEDMSGQNVKCDIEYQKDGSTLWTFKDGTGDTLQLELPSFTESDKSFDRNEIEVKKDPTGERMDNMKEALLDTFEFGFKHVKEKYSCSLDEQSRSKPAKKISNTEPNL